MISLPHSFDGKKMNNEMPLLALRSITKSFPGVVALDNVDFDLAHREVRGLVGQNGAGKSTLIKILCGAYKKDSGEILMEGQPVEIRNPNDALNLGLGFIHQELNVVLDRTVAENIFLGRLPTISRLGMVDHLKLIKEAESILESLGIELDPRRTLRTLSLGHCKIVEVAKAVSRDIKVMVMDEPTAALAAKEIKILFKLISSLKERGISVIYVSHQLDEIFRITDQVTVLRNGRNVGEEKSKEENRSGIISLMVGRKLDEMYPKDIISLGNELLRGESLTKKGYYQDISFTLHKGEILGIFGLIGSGQEAILRTICGALIPDSGNLAVLGTHQRIGSPTVARRNKIGLVPGNRRTEGLVLGHPIFANISLGSIEHFTRWGVLNPSLELKQADHWLTNLNIKARNPEQLIDDLSGGNQQKVVLSRLLEAKVDILLLEEPTAGVDVGARVEIYKILESLCQNGKGIIIVSSDLQEILSMTDRILAIKNGQIVGEFESKNATKEQILHKCL